MSRSERQTRGGALSVLLDDTPAGAFTARFSEQGLAGLDFPGSTRPVPPATAAPHTSGRINHWVELTKAAVLATLSGRQPAEFPPLDLSAGTEFQQRVWFALREIPPGQTRSYGAVAAAVQSPRATRAVGRACGMNPIPLLIPCHRVVAGTGGLGGFSGGLKWKRRLLAAEGVLAAPDRELDFAVPAP